MLFILNEKLVQASKQNNTPERAKFIDQINLEITKQHDELFELNKTGISFGELICGIFYKLTKGQA